MNRIRGWVSDRSLFSELAGVSIVTADPPCQVPCALDKICGRPFGWNKPHLCVHPSLIGRPLTEPVDVDGLPYLVVGAGFGIAMAFFLMALVFAVWKLVKLCFKCVRKCRARAYAPSPLPGVTPHTSVNQLASVYDSIPRSDKSGSEEPPALYDVPLDG